MSSRKPRRGSQFRVSNALAIVLHFTLQSGSNHCSDQREVGTTLQSVQLCRALMGGPRSEGLTTNLQDEKTTRPLGKYRQLPDISWLALYHLIQQFTLSSRVSRPANPRIPGTGEKRHYPSGQIQIWSNLKFRRDRKRQQSSRSILAEPKHEERSP